MRKQKGIEFWFSVPQQTLGLSWTMDLPAFNYCTRVAVLTSGDTRLQRARAPHTHTHIPSRNLQVFIFPFYDKSLNQSGNYIYRHTSTVRSAHRAVVSSVRFSQHIEAISPQRSKRFVFIMQNVFSVRCELNLCALCRHDMARQSVAGR